MKIDERACEDDGLGRTQGQKLEKKKEKAL
jgi:hypothetical protein